MRKKPSQHQQLTSPHHSSIPPEKISQAMMNENRRRGKEAAQSQHHAVKI